MSATLDIAFGNGHNEQSLVAWLKDTRGRWDSAGVNEGDRLVRALRGIPGTRLVVTDAGYDRAADTSVLVQDDHKSLGHMTKQVSDALGKSGSDLRRVAPPRTMTVAFYEHPVARALKAKGICHIVIHPDAGPKQLYGRNPRAPIVKEYRKTWAAARRQWKAARKAGYVCILTADAQMGKVARPWAPSTQARLMRAKTWFVNIDWLLYDRRLRLVHVDKHRLYDHTGFLAALTTR